MAKVISMPAKHQKHTKLTKPKGGRFHRNEWTVIGAPCSVLKEFVVSVSEKLQQANMTCGYLDMSHNAEDMNEGMDLLMEDKLSHWTIKSNKPLLERDFRKQFLPLDCLFVNGNHYKGDKQIVFIHPKKKESLERKLDRLTNVQMIVLCEGESSYYDYLKEYVSNEVSVIDIAQLDEIAVYILEQSNENKAPLKGLVLNGGKSQRMGSAKSHINYHGKPQSEYEADLLKQFCTTTYLSTSQHSVTEEGSSYESIPDTFIGLGPFGGILSAFRKDPNAAWLTVACDLPYLDKETVAQLVRARNTSKVATCFYNPETDFPEPLITIWEPRAYPILLDYLAQGYSCPRKVLINSDIEMIKMADPIKMKNANTPEERVEAEGYLKTRKR